MGFAMLLVAVGAKLAWTAAKWTVLLAVKAAALIGRAVKAVWSAATERSGRYGTPQGC